MMVIMNKKFHYFWTVYFQNNPGKQQVLSYYVHVVNIHLKLWSTLSE
jgi:hypothetical protein